MFLKRLTWFWILLTGIALLLGGRLVQIQVFGAARYEALAEDLLTRPARYLKAPRGSILDREGRLLLSDEPSSDITVHYAVLTGQSASYLLNVARQLRRRGDFPTSVRLEDAAAELRVRIGEMWQRLSELTGHPVSEFVERGELIRAQVERIRAAVAERRGIDRPVAEEEELHPVIEDVSPEVALAVQLELERMPWIRVTPSSRRVAQQADAAAHLLGQRGAVSPRHLERDPLRGDKRRELRPGDRVGITGVERIGETTLRGLRGRVLEDFDGTELERIEPQRGESLQLALDITLQEEVYRLLAAAIDGQDAQGNPRLTNPGGGAAVVLDVTTREVLALVSYPSYSYDTFREDFGALIRDAKRLPTRFRAVSGLYPPGSTCKAITLVGALADGVTTPEERIHCTGHLLEHKPGIFRCWIYNEYYPATHDWEFPQGQRGEDAIRNSCNIYFFKMGDRLGPGRLCEWFEQFGLGRTQETGLIEESPGIVPTAEYLQATQNRTFQASDPWNWSIGQGEVTASPLQVANVCASIAAGRWAPVRLLLDPPQPPAAERVALPAGPMHVLRRGMWRVINEPGGTAYKHARLKRSDYVFCGKTGSAQAVPQPVQYRYTFEWPDGRREEIYAFLERDALREAVERFGVEPQRVGKHTAERYPDLLPGELSAHAWFMGYTQPVDLPVGAAPTEGAYAVAVILEYGQSGGRVAGPVARDIAELVLERMP